MPLFSQAVQDSLTGLPSWEKFNQRAKKLLTRNGTDGLCIVYARVANFGAYCIRKGADAGNEVLKLIASMLRDDISTNLITRYDSESFVAIDTIDAIERTLERINRELPTDGEADGLVFKGGYCLLSTELSLDETLARANYAFEDILYGSLVWSRMFDRGLETVYNRRNYVIHHLDEAIERGEIRAYAQPIVRVLTGMICEVEILSRWVSDVYGFLRPDEFIPELERHQLIHRLDAEVVRLACKQWSEASQLGINVPFGINLSRLDFELCDMYDVVTQSMATYHVPIDQVHIEITESALAHSSSMLAKGIERFRKAGFSLYLDDFGSGYSSLQVLEGTSFDVVKLDMSLLTEVETNERARVIVADAVSMVKRLNLQTLCEGVETEEQFLFLKAVGCEKAQGYRFSKPQSHEEIMLHLKETARRHETPEMQRYYDSVGKVNLMDGTRASVHGVEAAHFQGTQPFAIIEIVAGNVSFLSANSAFYRFVQRAGEQDFESLIAQLAKKYPSIRNKVFYATSKARKTNMPQQLDVVIEGQLCTIGVTYVEESEGKTAYLVEILSVTRYSKFNNFKVLEQSMSFLYTIFKRIDLLDMTDHTWRNIYLNVPRYNALRADATPQDEIEAFCEAFIHPDDRARFLEFYNLDTVYERLTQVATTHLADIFYALTENRYEEQLFMLIPASIDGHRQFLSCMRDLDVGGMVHQKAVSDAHIYDDVLLSGLLEVTNHCVFWKDARRRFVGANDNFLSFFGFSSANQFVGKTDDDLGWIRNANFHSDERKVLSGERVHNVQAQTERGDGELRNIRVSKIPLWHKDKVVGLVGYFEDLGPHIEPEMTV